MNLIQTAGDIQSLSKAEKIAYLKKIAAGDVPTAPRLLTVLVSKSRIHHYMPGRKPFAAPGSPAHHPNIRLNQFIKLS